MRPISPRSTVPQTQATAASSSSAASAVVTPTTTVVEPVGLPDSVIVKPIGAIVVVPSAQPALLQVEAAANAAGKLAESGIHALVVETGDPVDTAVIARSMKDRIVLDTVVVVVQAGAQPTAQEMHAINQVTQKMADLTRDMSPKALGSAGYDAPVRLNASDATTCGHLMNAAVAQCKSVENEVIESQIQDWVRRCTPVRESGTPTHSSDNLQRTQDYCTQLMRDGKAAGRWACDYPIPLPLCATAVWAPDPEKLASMGDLPPWVTKVRFEAYTREPLRVPEPDHLPAGLTHLLVKGTVVVLPEKLSPSLRHLTIEDTPMRAVPIAMAQLPGLKELHLPDNKIETLPDAGFSHKLTRLNLAQNKLTDFPAFTERPVDLRNLDLESNQITNVADWVFTLPSTCTINLEGNPLSMRAIAHMMTVTNAPGFNGPRILFDMAAAIRANADSDVESDDEQSRANGPAWWGATVPVDADSDVESDVDAGSDADSDDEPSDQAQDEILSDAVAAWLPHATSTGTASSSSSTLATSAWKAFDETPGAATFAGFLRRLQEESIFEDPTGRDEVKTILQAMLSDGALREQCFAQMIESTISCDDRVSRSYVKLRIVVLAHTVASGAKNDNLPLIVGTARGIFRLELLELIAAQKIAKMNAVDEVEVSLAYPRMLHAELKLPGRAPDMKFFGVSGVTPDDLKTASARVKSEENTNFLPFLASWEPWRKVLAQIEPDKYQQIMDSTYGDLEMLSRVNLEVQAQASAGALPQDSVVGEVKRRIDEIANAAILQLTRDAIESRGAASELAPPWN